VASFLCQKKVSTWNYKVLPFTQIAAIIPSPPKTHEFANLSCFKLIRLRLSQMNMATLSSNRAWRRRKNLSFQLHLPRPPRRRPQLLLLRSLSLLRMRPRSMPDSAFCRREFSLWLSSRASWDICAWETKRREDIRKKAWREEE
jgi:hypothetical protein